MLKIENLKISFGNSLLFDTVKFNINKKEKIGLIGRNGSGKTTLFNLLTKQVEPGSGTILIPKKYKIGLVKQELSFETPVVLDEASLGLPVEQKNETWRAAKILSGLGFTENDMKEKPSELSGGFQIRLNLAKVLVSDPDLLLLDEPTNYLDIVSIRWLISFLRSWKKELVLITHDRSLMDQIVTHTMIIHRQKIKKIPGQTSKIYEQIATEEETYEKTRINDEKKRKEIEIFINRFRSKARLANSVQSRVKALKKRIQLKKLETIENLAFSFTNSPLTAKHLMDVKKLSFDYNANSQMPLIDDFNLTVNNGDRICTMGKNGKGKTTLLRLLARELKTGRGHIKSTPGLSIGIYDQLGIEKLNRDNSIEEEIMSGSKQGCSRQKARDICGAMMFSGDLALKKIEVLSGGEKSRVLLGKILVTPCNMLLLDEPTNHLDMESCDSLMSAIDNFPGAVIMVTHNEMFLNAIAKRLIIFDDNRITVFEGAYQEFLERTGWQDEKDLKQITEKSEINNAVNKKEIRKQRAEALKEKTKIAAPLEKKMADIEKNIGVMESEVHDINKELISASTEGQGEKINKLSKQIHTLQQRIDSLYDDLHFHSSKLEEVENFLNKK